MNKLRWHPAIAVAVGMAVALGCGDGVGPDTGGPGGILPVAGTLVVSLTTPNSDDGAILVSISGGTINSAAGSSSSNAFFSRTISSSLINAVIAGNIDAGVLMTINVPDVQAVSNYSGTVMEVADRSNKLRSSTSGYSLSIARR